ncbi:follistatin-related protein 1 [Patella vulgata]|uniref:follistatin-related protein 1 n=1 Tax=Patella vulgata TaxID=6465 RepID=UPI0021807FE1|nr:follistatin-related protein 1 [Patella vulgata]XP_050415278.1 follistatin-related protein 1 [Patella vulgata]XP_050415279.1 follistatin-related protein 1 [Patella vulgata]XP_050415280.1 follistatin-related protein 1 [Patella vulgata]
MMRLLLLVCVVVVLLSPTEAKSKRKPSKKEARQCGNERCKSGRRCVTRYDGEKTCICRKRCKSKQYLVCGSDGNTYTNYCHLHRSACLDNKHMSVLHTGPCLIEFNEVEKEIEKKSAGSRRPLVCYQIQRDELRQLLVDWLKTKVASGKPYSDVVVETFTKCDEDKDGNLDGDEMLKCTEKDEKETDTSLHILRGLCMDALINMGDDNNDWLLNRDEFATVFGLHFTPPAGECSLEDKTYSDGAQTKLDCNVCVCACGNWVCTGAPCFKGKEMGVPGPVVDGRLPGRKETEELLQGFRAVHHVKLSDVENEVKDAAIKDEIVQQLNKMKVDKDAHM